MQNKMLFKVRTIQTLTFQRSWAFFSQSSFEKLKQIFMLDYYLRLIHFFFSGEHLEV